MLLSKGGNLSHLTIFGAEITPHEQVNILSRRFCNGCRRNGSITLSKRLISLKGKPRDES